jgi:hypothetical protein
MKHENGSGNAKDVNCDVNADPSAPGARGTIRGELKWSISASEIWCSSIMHSMHTTIHNIF